MSHPVNHTGRRRPLHFHHVLGWITTLTILVGMLAVSIILVGPGPARHNTIFLVEKGQSLNAITTNLQHQQLIFDGTLFKALALITGMHNALKAGEYEIPARASLATVYTILRTGRSQPHFITIPEGLTVKQIIELLDKDPNLTGTVTNIPQEGELLPNTYEYVRGMTRQQMIDQMKESMARTIMDLWPRRSNRLPYQTQAEAIILASIVEKETGATEERPIVASVFINRLRLGMKLQTDPTVVYAITNGYGHMRGERLYAKDLSVDSPYNTYKYKGLPPGAIANPGMASLIAVLSPSDTKYLYFVASGGGHHAFAKSAQEHNRNVQKWRKIRQEIEAQP